MKDLTYLEPYRQKGDEKRLYGVNGDAGNGIFKVFVSGKSVCNLHHDLADAVKACENSAGCRHRFTLEEAKKIVIEREGGLPVIPREKTEPSEESDPQVSMNDAFARIAEAACKAANSIRDLLNHLVQNSTEEKE